jgi:hypothetical protein
VLLTGTPTPTPENLWVIVPTPTPLIIYVWDLPPSPLATPTRSALPGVFEGRIGFISDRRGEPAAYMMNIDGSGVAWFTDPWAYEFSSDRQQPAPDGNGYVSPNGQYIVYAAGEPGKQQVWIKNADGSNPQNISKNGYNEYGPVWLRSQAPPPTPTLTPTQPPAPESPAPGSGSDSGDSGSKPKPKPKPKPPA